MAEKHWSEKDDDELTYDDLGEMLAAGEKVTVRPHVRQWAATSPVACTLTTAAPAYRPTFCGQPMIPILAAQD